MQFHATAVSKLTRSLLSGILLAASFVVHAESLDERSAVRVPLKTWLEDYTVFFDQNHLEPDAMLTAPAIWLFSPNGDMARIITADPDLENLKKAFPPEPVAGLSTKQPTRDQAA